MAARAALVAGLALTLAGCAPEPSAPTPEPVREQQTLRLQEEPAFARLFEEAGVTGTLVVLDPARSRVLVHDSVRARERFLPASTFKVANALVALETGAVADTLKRFIWDGTEREIAPWNRDHTLATAFENSVVWAFQDVARRIGEGEMERRLLTFDYGNADIGGGIDRFWLTGDLRISALEQVRFLRRLRERQLPVSERTATLVEGIMREGRSGEATLHAKTGWADLDALDPERTDLGWYVGFVAREEGVVYFALNLDLERPDQAPLRRSIALQALADLGLY